MWLTLSGHLLLNIFLGQRGEVAHYFLERWRGADDADRATRYQRLHVLYAPEARELVEEAAQQRHEPLQCDAVTSP